MAVVNGQVPEFYLLSEDRIDILAPAKINLFLKIVGKRPDGYHEIESLFQAVSLFDSITITRAEKGIRLSAEPDEVPTGPENLVYQAAELFFSELGVRGGAEIRLQKRIPVAAGLGGGSSDAAATLVGLCGLHGVRAARHDIADLGLRIGSDVPFFLFGGSALVGGRGEVIKPVRMSTDYAVAILMPDCRVRASDAYEWAKKDLTSDKSGTTMMVGTEVCDLLRVAHDLDNDLEPGVESYFPRIGRLRECLTARGASLARMSGSGPAVFGIFEKLADAREVISSKQCEGVKAYACCPTPPGQYDRLMDW